MTRAVLPVLALLLALTAPLPASAASKAAARVLDDFRVDGRIDPCEHSERDLRDTKRRIPPDIEQYAPDFPAAVEAALEARARGECDPRSPRDPETPAPAGTASPPASSSGPPAQQRAASPAPATEPAAVATPTPVAEPPAPVVASTRAPARGAAEREIVQQAAVTEPRNQAPLPVVALALLSALLALAALAVLALRSTLVSEVPALAGARHAWSEAAWRSQGAWQDFLDWVRLGR